MKTIKQWLAIILVLAFALSMVSCGMPVSDESSDDAYAVQDEDNADADEAFRVG